MSFHGLFCVVFAAFMLIRLYGRVRARTWQREQHRPEGHVVVAGRFLVGIPLIAYVFKYVFKPSIAGWAVLNLPVWARWLGLVLSVAAVAFLAWVQASLGRNFSATLRIRNDHHLVTNGPYRYVRHPMYSALVLQFCGWLLLTANAIIGGGGLLICAVLMILRTPREERMMLEAFGPQYADYMARTGRYLPRVWRRRPMVVSAEPS